MIDLNLDNSYICNNNEYERKNGNFVHLFIFMNVCVRTDSCVTLNRYLHYVRRPN